jgi:hypothetical protein
MIIDKALILLMALLFSAVAVDKTIINIIHYIRMDVSMFQMNKAHDRIYIVPPIVTIFAMLWWCIFYCLTFIKF